MTSIVEIATATAALLTTGRTAGWFAGYPAIGTIERRWAADWQIADVETLRIGVVPQSQERDKITRIADTLDVVVGVSLMAHLPEGTSVITATALDGYVNLGLRMADVLSAGLLPAPAADAKLVSLAHVVIDQDRLIQSRCFFSTITLTWRVARDARVGLPT